MAAELFRADTRTGTMKISHSSSSSSSSLFLSINPIIDTYHEDVEMVT
jgi:hypothetical protein